MGFSRLPLFILLLLSLAAYAEDHTLKLPRAVETGCALIQKSGDELPVLEAFAEKAASTLEFHTGQKLYADFLALQGKSKPVETATSILNVLQRLRGADRGELIAVLGEVSTFLPKKHKLTPIIQRVLWGGMTLMEANPELLKSYQENFEGALEQTVSSAYAGFAARARADLEKRAKRAEDRFVSSDEWKALTKSKASEAAEVLLLAPPAERDAYLQEYFTNWLKNQKELDFKHFPILQLMARSPSTQRMANKILAKYGLEDADSSTNRKFAEKWKDGFKKEREKLAETLREIRPELLELTHFALDVGSLSGPTAGAICSAVNAMVYLGEGREREALVAALGVLPGLTHMRMAYAVGTKMRRFLDVAHKFEKVVGQIARVQKQIAEADRMISLAQGVLQRIEDGDPLVDDETTRHLLRLGLNRTKLPRLADQLSTLYTGRIERSPAMQLAKALGEPGATLDDVAEGMCTAKRSAVTRALNFIEQQITPPKCVQRAAHKARTALDQFKGMFDQVPKSFDLENPEQTIDRIAELYKLTRNQIVTFKAEVASRLKARRFVSQNEVHAIASAARVAPDVAFTNPYFPSAPPQFASGEFSEPLPLDPRTYFPKR